MARSVRWSCCDLSVALFPCMMCLHLECALLCSCWALHEHKYPAQAKNVNAYERSKRKGSDYSYSAATGRNNAGPRDKGRGSLNNDLKRAMPGTRGNDLKRLDREIRSLDPLTRNLDPTEFMHQPQRFPHKDGADLGDNYVGSFSDEHGSESDDNLVLASEAAMKQPREFSTFLGDSKRESKPEYASHHLPAKDLKRLKQNPRLLKYANADDAFGKHSPLNSKMRKMLYGNSDAYQRNKFGYPSDVLPSTRQYKAQVSPNRGNYPRTNPLASKLKQRWRPYPEGCRGSKCIWKPVLEDANKECDKDVCSEVCKGDSCGEDADPVEVCGPLGCDKATPNVEADDPLAKQMEKGALGTRAAALPFPIGLLSIPTPCPCGLLCGSRVSRDVAQR